MIFCSTTIIVELYFVVLIHEIIHIIILIIAGYLQNFNKSIRVIFFCVTLLQPVLPIRSNNRFLCSRKFIFLRARTFFEICNYHLVFENRASYSTKNANTLMSPCVSLPTTSPLSVIVHESHYVFSYFVVTIQTAVNCPPLRKSRDINLAVPHLLENIGAYIREPKRGLSVYNLNYHDNYYTNCYISTLMMNFNR